MLNIHLAIRFFIELAVLIFIGFWGFTIDGNVLIKGLAGIGGPLAIALLWGAFIAPKATNSINSLGKIMIEAAIFLLGIYVVYARFGKMAALILTVVMVLNSSYVHFKTTFFKKSNL